MISERATKIIFFCSFSCTVALTILVIASAVSVQRSASYAQAIVALLMFITAVKMMIVYRLICQVVTLFAIYAVDVLLLMHLVLLLSLLSPVMRKQLSLTSATFIITAVAVAMVADVATFVSGIIYYKCVPYAQAEPPGIEPRMEQRMPRRSSNTASFVIEVDLSQINRNASVNPPRYNVIMPPDEIHNVDAWITNAVHPGHVRFKIRSADEIRFVTNPESSSHGLLPSYESATHLTRPAPPPTAESEDGRVSTIVGSKPSTPDRDETSDIQNTRQPVENSDQNAPPTEDEFTEAGLGEDIGMQMRAITPEEAPS